MNPVLRLQMHSLLSNLWGGVKLALFRPVPRRAFHTNPHQGVMLFVLGVALMATYNYLSVEPQRVFNPWGLFTEAAALLILLFSAYVLASLRGRVGQARAFTVIMLSAAVPYWIGTTAIYELLGHILGTNETRYWSGFIVSMIWLCVIAGRTAALLFRLDFKPALGMMTVFALINVPLAYFMPPTTLWYAMPGEPGNDLPQRARINVEDTFYAQPARVDAAAGALEAQRPGIPDLYFLSFGAYARQDVFLKEALFTRELFDRRFDTRGRSLVLVNNPRTVDEIALANGHNLERALRHIADRMDTEEDILFLYLTSHGSRNHKLAVDFRPLRMNPLSAARLRELLDASGIKWRVIVVSACYSGGFIDALEDANSLILTASHRDRQSFGCGNENDFTYFGEAYFKQQLEQQDSFIQAFYAARGRIAAREASERLDPSEPQIHIGEAIKAPLGAFQAHLKGMGVRRLAQTRGVDPN